MNLRFEDGGMFVRLVDGVRDLVPEVLMTVNANEGLKWQEMDSSHVSMVSVQLRPNSFSELHTTDPGRTIPVGVNMTALSKYLHCGTKLNRISWQMNEKITNVLEIITEKENAKDNNKSGKGKNGRFSLNLINIDREALGVQEIDYVAHVFIHSANFQRIIKELATLSTDLTMTVTEEEIRFSVDGDSGSAELTVPNKRHPKIKGTATFDCFREMRDTKDDKADEDDLAYIFIPPKSKVQVKFAMKFLVLFCKCTSLSPHLQISLLNENPIRLQYPLYRPPQKKEPTQSVQPEKKEEKKEKMMVLGKRKKEVVATPGSAEPGTADISGLVSFYLAPKMDDEKSNEPQTEQQEQQQ